MKIETASNDEELHQTSLAALDRVVRIHCSIGENSFEHTMRGFKHLRPLLENAIRASPTSVTKRVQEVLVTYRLIDEQVFRGL